MSPDIIKDTGAFTVNTLSMGIKTAAGTGAAQGTLNVGGGTFTVNAPSPSARRRQRAPPRPP